MDRGVCVAPGCGADTASPYHDLCDACRQRVEDAMVKARPSLMELMVKERAEAEAWLAAAWAPKRRWVIADDDYHEQPLADVVTRMVEKTASGWGSPYLAFVDDALWQKRQQWRREHAPETVSAPLSAWLIPGESDTARAWRSHLAPLVRAAVEQALATFPLIHAGREIKDVMMQHGDYGQDDAWDAFEEVWESRGDTGLSAGAEDYLELRYVPDETWMCDADDWPDSMGAHLWQRYRVLSDEIMAILDAVRAHVAKGAA